MYHVSSVIKGSILSHSLSVDSYKVSWRYSSIQCALQGWPLHWWLVKRAHPSSVQPPPLPASQSGAIANVGQNASQSCELQTGSSSPLYRHTHDSTRCSEKNRKISQIEVQPVWPYQNIFETYPYAGAYLKYLWCESGVIETIYQHVECGDTARHQTQTGDRTGFCQTDEWIFSLHDTLRRVIIL